MAVDISASLVKELREKTGVGFMECKKALQEAQGDLDKAVRILRERGVAKAEKRAGRAAAEGLVGLRISADEHKASLVELNSETDFVARNESFRSFLSDLVDFVDNLPQDQVPQAAAAAGAPGELLLDKPFTANPERTLREELVSRIATIGENIVFRRLARYETQDGFLTGYIHPPGKIGVVVELEVEGGAPSADREALVVAAKDVAMHVAASAPRYLDRSVVDASHLEAEKEIAANKARNEGKPDKIIPKIVEGMVQKFYKDVCLVDQPFVKDPNVSVGKMVQEAGRAMGKSVSIKRFVRFQVGEDTGAEA